MYEAKTTKISNFWTFWPIIQLIKDGLLAYGQNVQKLLIFAVFPSDIASILKRWT